MVATGMTSPRIRLNTEQAEDFAVLCGLGAEKLESVESALASLKTPDRSMLPAAELSRVVTEAIGERGARALLRELVGFGVGVRRGVFDYDVVDAISDALKDRGEDDTRTGWDSIKDHFWKLLSQSHIKHAVKAFDLSFDYTNLFHDARIITDMRPVFEDEHSTVIGTVVRHIIRLEYMSPESRLTSLSIAIDRKDVEELRKWCDEALKKEAAISRYVEEPHRVQKLTPGDERDELR